VRTLSTGPKPSTNVLGHFFARVFLYEVSYPFNPDEAGGTQSASGYLATKRNGRTLTLTRFQCSIPRDESRNVRARTDA
jgi:hypothetical protein